MTGSRLKLLSLVLVAALAALVLLAWSQPWFTVDSAGDETVTVGGDVAGAALPPLALASLALVLALAIAGPVLPDHPRHPRGPARRRASLVVSAIALGDPDRGLGARRSPRRPACPGPTRSPASSSRVTDDGLAGRRDRRRRPDGACSDVADRGHRRHAGRRSGRKYSRSRLESADASSPIDEWDALSEGDDPTSREP